MAKKKREGNFIQKDIGKKAPFKVLNATITGGSSIGLAYGVNALKPKLPEKIQKWLGTGIFAIGTAIEVFVEQEQVVAIAKSMQSVGALDTAGSFASPEFRGRIALAGVGQKVVVDKKDNKAIDWENIIEEASKEIDGLGVEVEIKDEVVSDEEAEAIQKLNDEAIAEEAREAELEQEEIEREKGDIESEKFEISGAEDEFMIVN